MARTLPLHDSTNATSALCGTWKKSINFVEIEVHHAHICRCYPALILQLCRVLRVRWPYRHRSCALRSLRTRNGQGQSRPMSTPSEISSGRFTAPSQLRRTENLTKIVCGLSSSQEDASCPMFRGILPAWRIFAIFPRMSMRRTQMPTPPRQAFLTAILLTKSKSAAIRAWTGNKRPPL